VGTVASTRHTLNRQQAQFCRAEIGVNFLEGTVALTLVNFFKKGEVFLFIDPKKSKLRGFVSHDFRETKF
jgi:hypothetical protein